MALPFLGPLIAAATGALSRLIASRVGMWVVSALGFLGLSFATHTVAIEPMLQMVHSNMAGVGGDIAAWMGVLRLDQYVSVIISAYAVGAIKRAFLARRVV